MGFLVQLTKVGFCIVNRRYVLVKLQLGVICTHMVDFCRPGYIFVIFFQWIPLLEDGELKTGSYNLCVSAEKPPAAYSQLKTDVRG